MFVFLHLHAAVVNALDAAQATHLLIDTQVLKKVQILLGVRVNKTCFMD